MDDRVPEPPEDERVVGAEDDDAEGPPASTTTGWEIWDVPPAERHLRDLPSVSWSAIRFVWQADRRSFLITVANDVLAGVVGALQVLVVGAVLSRLLSDQTPADAARSAAPWVALLVVVGAVSNLANAYVRGRSELFQERVGYASSRRLIEVASRVDLLAFESPAFFDRLVRVQAQAHFRPMQVVQSTTQLLSGVAGSLGVLVALAIIQPWLVPIVVLTFVPVMAAMHRGAWHDFQFVRGMSQLERRRMYISLLLTDRDSAKEVRAFGLQAALLGRYDSLWRRRMDELRPVVARKTRLSAAAELASAAVTAIAVGSLLVLFGRGNLSVAAAGAALSGLLQLRARFGGLTFGAAGLYEAVLYLHDQRDLVELAEHLAADEPSRPAPPRFERMCLEDVSFVYPEGSRAAVDHVDLEIRAGEVVALVGENGSGKTTLAKLMARLYEPTAGTVRWDGTDLHDVDREALRRSITVVFQDFERYNLTAGENIGLGDVDRLDDESAIVAAAVRAGADSMIRRLPHGYDTVLGRMFDAGQDLSAGQWQRIAVARAFFRDAPFVILDEPTASLDARAEHELFERIRSLFQGRSVLLISHRFSTVRSADRIYVLHRGRVIEHGSHDELMERRGTYAELFHLQASAFLEPATTPHTGDDLTAD